jgi:hypothetical protein
MKCLSVAAIPLAVFLLTTAAMSTAECQTTQATSASSPTSRTPAVQAGAQGAPTAQGATSVKSTSTNLSVTPAATSAPPAKTAGAPAAAASAAAAPAATRVVTGGPCIARADPDNCKVDEPTHAHMEHQKKCDEKEPKWTEDCQWDRGYAWARINNVTSLDECSGRGFPSKFYSGCHAYAQDYVQDHATAKQ